MSRALDAFCTSCGNLHLVIHHACCANARADRADLEEQYERVVSKVLAVEAECDRLAANRGGWDRDIAELFRAVLRSVDEDGQT